MEEKIVTEETKVEKVNFITKHTKGIKRGLAVVGGLVGIAVAGAIINKKVSGNEDFVGYGNDPYSGTEGLSSDDSGKED